MRELDTHEMECVSGGRRSGSGAPPPPGGNQSPPPGGGHVFAAAKIVQGVHQDVTIAQVGGHVTIGG